jgi:hypothetical protein
MDAMNYMGTAALSVIERQNETKIVAQKCSKWAASACIGAYSPS